jgi:hypothetical protein
MQPRSRSLLIVPALAGLLGGLASCAPRPPINWGSYDILKGPIPAAPVQVRGVNVEPKDYERLRELGQWWFRDSAFGNERSISDVMGVFQGTVEVPCANGAAGCYEKKTVLPYVLDGIDRLDGVMGNLFQGNGGPEGTGYTSDLVLYFPKGTRLYGSVAVPEELHLGLDVEAGQSMPIGIAAVPAPADETDNGFLPDLSTMGYPDAPKGKMRFRLACAACHYSLDVDNDGKADLRSAELNQPTPGSPYKPEDAWGVGNHDVSFGWLFSLAENPILGAPVLAGYTGGKDANDAIKFMNWVRDNYKTQPVETARAVVVGMLAQPRGYADVTTDGIYNPMQLPTLYTRHSWPANSDGAQGNDSDRNNTVWTGALDFTGLIGLCSDRGSSVQLPWEPPSIFGQLSCQEFADLMTWYSPAARFKPELQKKYAEDILGTSDGVPGMLDPASVVVMVTPTLPKSIAESQINIAAHRVRTPDDYGGDGPMRGAGMAALGVRIGVEEKYVAELKPLADKYKLDLDDLMSDSVSAALDWMDPPPNKTALLANAAGLVERGYQVFRAAGCEQCHRGPYTTDNVIHPLSADPRIQFGGPRAPTTAGWRVIDRGVGPPIDTDPQRSWNTRNLRRFISPPYDPATGMAYRKGGVLNGLMSVQSVGYKTTGLRYLWGSAPYLHDGGIGVGLRPGSAPPGDELAALLARAGGPDVIYGMGELLTSSEPNPLAGARANPALSLQALVLESERKKVVASNAEPRYKLWAGSTSQVVGGEPVTEVSMASMAVVGKGHDFYINDTPGGPDVTALVAFLLALDDCPRDLPGKPAQGDCHAPLHGASTPAYGASK